MIEIGQKQNRSSMIMKKVMNFERIMKQDRNTQDRNEKHRNRIEAPDYKKGRNHSNHSVME